MAKIGRPTKYKPQYCQRIIELGRDGNQPVALCAELLVGKSTMHMWRENYPDFRDAFDVSRQLCEQYWLNLAKNRANGTMNGSDVMIKFILSAAHGHREKSDVTTEVTADVTHHGQVDINFVDMHP
jgi:hypothetical protein